MHRVNQRKFTCAGQTGVKIQLIRKGTGKELTKMLINDRYELKKEIRRGGFGVTWYAWDTNLDMPVAIKEFSDPDPEHRRKFIREARSLAKVSGARGIVNVRDYLEADGKAYMVMEYLDGEDLSARIDRTGRLGFDETWQLLLPLMGVLKKLHESGMIHRDVSPDNIRITEDGEVKLLDFGSVSNLTSENLTRTVTVKPGYAPIEQYSGAAEQGPWTDVYSLCATIYKCITGRKPADSLVRSFHDELERPSALGVKISPEEEKVLMKGLSVNPKERYDTVNGFIDAMEAARTAPKDSPVSGMSGSAGSGSSAGGRSLEELASKAFSDEADGGKGEPEAAQERKSGRPGQPGQAGQPDVQPAQPGEQPAQPGQAAQPGVQPAQPGNPGQPTRTDTPSGSGKQGRRKKNKFLIPAIAAGALVLGIAVFVLLPKGDGSGGGGGVIPTSIVTGSAEGVDYDSGDTYVTIADTTINDAHINFVEKNDKITTVYFRRCSVPDEMISKMADWSRVESLSFNYCGGYTSMDPLAGLATLGSIEIYDNSDAVFAGDRVFTNDFPETVKKLMVIGGTLEGTAGFIRHFPGLSTLTLNVANQVDDYSFLDALPELEYLYLYNQSLDEEDCSHLSGHAKLGFVDLTDGSLATLDWAKDCPGIRYIDAEDSPITDLSPLAGHELLYTLRIPGSQVSDLTPLSSCPALSNLNVARSQVSSLAGLENAKKLFSLNISRCSVSDLAPLKECAELEELYADRNKITSISEISNCGKILTIDVNRNELTNLDGCEDLIKLKTLKAAGNHISDISGIRNCTVIEALFLSENGIEDISALSNNFTDLKVLDISDNQVRDISALAGCVSLSGFAADNNKITAINVLAEKPGLYGVFLSNNELTDITPLRDSMDNLSYLDIGNNNVRDVSFLKNLSVKKVWLLMENNEISDVSMLPAMLEYHQLVFYGNPIRDISVVSGMTNTLWTKLYLSHDDNLDYGALGSSSVNDDVILVDVPSDKKASVLKQFKGNRWYEPAFMTGEEADAEMESYRAEIKRTVIGDSGEEEEAESSGAAAGEAEAEDEAAGTTADQGAEEDNGQN